MNFLAKLFSGSRTVQKRGYLSGFDKDQVRERWAKIEELKLLNKPSTLRESVIEADKLVDSSLSKIYPGEERAADRLVQAKEIFASHKQDYENLWYGHKIRNEMVHTVGFDLPSIEAKNILDYYQRALEILGLI